MNGLHPGQLGTDNTLSKRYETATRTYHLSRRHTYSLDGEFAPTHIKQILQTGSQ